LISSWTDQKLVLGQDWNDEIQNEFKLSDIYILLLSSDFFSSSYINTIETKIALKSEESGAVILPIFLRQCDFQGHKWLSDRHGAPKGRWVSDFETPAEKDEINDLLSKAIRAAVDRFVAKKQTANKVYFGISNNMKLSRERTRINYALIRYEENSEDICFSIGPTPDEYESLLDLNEADFKTAVHQSLTESSIFIVLLNEKDEYCNWQIEVLKSYSQTQGMDQLSRVFLFHNNDDDTTPFHSEITAFVAEHKEKVLYQFCDNSADMSRIITEELEEVFENEKESESVKGEKKRITFFFDPEDARNLFKWKIKQRLDEDDEIDVITRPDAKHLSITKEMLAESNGVALYYGQANHNWFDTIQVYLRKFFVNEKRIDPRIVFIDEPDVDVKDQMFVNRDLLNNNKHREVCILSNQEQVAQDLELFIQRVKQSNG